jgi:hypothetical protein
MTFVKVAAVQCVCFQEVTSGWLSMDDVYGREHAASIHVCRGYLLQPRDGLVAC